MAPKTKPLDEQTAIIQMVKQAIAPLAKALEELTVQVQNIEDVVYKKPAPSIQKMETFNGEVAPEPEDNMRMGTEDKIQSARNACAILPPNMIVNGRHIKENVEAICGFKVDDEFMDLVYCDGWTHEK
jgi:hypothetical protein